MAEKYGNSLVYYILLRDKTAEKDKNHSISIRSSTKVIALLKGEILCRNVHPVAVVHNGSMTLHPYSKPSYIVVCYNDEVQQIKEEQAKLLLPISTMVDRYNIHVNNLLENGRKMTIGTNVYVKVNKQEFRGTIRYKGPLPDQDGTMFGVELTEGLGRGTTNGFFKAERYFHCQTDCGVFVSFEKLRLACEENNMLTKITSKISEGWSNLVSGKQTHENSSKAVDKSMAEKSRNNVLNHKVEDRVWVFINDEKPHGGYIRFIGRPPAGKNILAGIELDHPVGQGNGEYYGKQLMNCEMNHAHFTLIENVISREKLKEIWEKPNKVTPALKDKLPSSPQTSLDIVNMESNFSKQSKAEVIKEQEQLFKKIKQEGREQEDRHFGEDGIGPSLDLTDEKQSKLKNHVSHATLQMNTHRVSKGEPSLSSSMKNNLDIGSMVEVLTKNGNPIYGVIRWLGFLPASDKKIAGLELEEEMNACSDGTFHGIRYFDCPSRRAFFVHLHNCTPDSRFNKNSIENAANKRLTGTDFGPYESPTIEDDFIPPPETLEVYLEKGARGIQGHHNSCYLDATLFAAFAFSSVMDSILLRPRDETDIEQYEKVQNVLRNNIVSPLRDSGFVRADRVLELRQLLDQLGTVTGLVGEEKDPEEFLLTLLQQVLKSEPFLKIKSGKEVRNEYCYQVLADRDAERVLPSVEELLKRSFHQSDLKLTEVPSCLIVQMPRFGKGFKMYDRILPSLTINIGEVVENSPQDCAVCGRLALFHCRDCFSVTGNDDRDSSGNYCKDCNDLVHSHMKRAQHNKLRPIAVPRDIRASYANKPVEHREMELFAVICIETSHYVTFAKCEQPDGIMKWCFFDSMADRVGTKNGYNVPSVSECPEVIEWLSSEKQNRERIINTSDKEMPDRVRRILGDAYVCLYESKEMAMYK